MKKKSFTDKIENLYEDYRKIEMKNISQREELVWDKIDSLSNEAAKYAILMSMTKCLPLWEQKAQMHIHHLKKLFM